MMVAQVRVSWKGVALVVLGLAFGFFLWLARYSQGSWRFMMTRLLFDRAYSHERRELDDQARSGLSSTYYFTSYYLHGMLSAVEATQDDRLLRRTLRILDQMVDRAQPFDANGRRFHVWPPFSVTADSALPRPNLHFTFQATVPLARAAAIIRSHPRFRARYEDHAKRYCDFVDQAVFQYWYDIQLKRKIPWIDPDHFPIWNDNGANIALNAVFMYEATQDPLYRDIAVRIGEHFKSKLRPQRAGWIWENQTIPIGSDTDNTPGSVGNQAGVPDVSHTNREAFLVTSFYEAGLVFSRDDVERMAHTFTDILWNQSTDNPSFSNYLNGSNEPYRVYKEPGLNGPIYHGWAWVGAYSPKAQEILLDTLKAIWIGRRNPSLERNATSYGGMVALAGHLLRNFHVGGLQQPLQWHWSLRNLRDGFLHWLNPAYTR